MVVGILAIVSSAAVPYAEITFIRGKESELQSNLTTIRSAIQRWHDDCAAQLVAKSPTGYPGGGRQAWLDLQDCFLYPADLSYLTLASNTYVQGKHQNGVTPINFTFSHPAFLREVPVDPFVGYATWTPLVATAVGSPFAGIIDVSPVADPTTRRGFTDAIDGTKYQDW